MAFSQKQAEEYLNSLINYETLRRRSRRNFHLANIRFLTKKMAVDLSGKNIIHIAGTKGKGSTAVLCAHILAMAGYKTGLYTSPHISRVNERIKILQKKEFSVEEKSIPSKDFAGLLQEIKKNSSAKRISYFEALTILALKFFEKEKVRCLVLETGLGGMLDSTNVVNSDVAVITRIGKDHTEVLGSTLPEIARQKCGIIKKDADVVAFASRPSVLKVVKAQANVCSADRLFVFNRDFKPVNLRLGRQSTIFDFHSLRYIAGVRIKLKGRHQAENACLAIQAVLSLADKKNLEISSSRIKQAVKNVCLPGRLEVAGKNPLVILDAAHNIDSACALAQSLKSYWPGYKYIYLFSACRDKNVKAMLRVMPAGKWFFTKTDNPRLLAPEEIRRISGIKNACVEKNPVKALLKALSMYNNNSAIVVWGSFFIVSKIRSLVDRRKNVL